MLSTVNMPRTVSRNREIYVLAANYLQVRNHR